MLYVYDVADTVPQLKVGSVLLLQNQGKIFVIHLLWSLNGKPRNLPSAQIFLHILKEQQ